MKKLLILAVLLCTAVFAADLPGTPGSPTTTTVTSEMHPAKLAPAASPMTVNLDVLKAVEKERDELKAQVALIPQYEQRVQYLSVLAERNELAVRVVQLQLNDTLARNKQLETELAAAKATPAAPAPKK